MKPRFGGSSIGIDVVEDLATASARLTANPHLRFGAVVEPYRPDLSDLQIAVRTWPSLELSAIERPIRASGAADILDYRDKYVAGEGMAGARRELPAQIPPELERRSADGGRARSPALAAVRGVARIDFLSDGRDVRGQRGQHHPGLPGPLPVGRPGGAVRHAARTTCWTRPPATHPRLLGRRGRRDGAPFGRIDRRQVGLRRLAVHRLQLLPDERILVDIRPHWLFLSGPWRRRVVTSAWVWPSTSAYPHTTVAVHWIEGLVVAVPCLWLAARAARWRTTSLVLTSVRLVEQWGTLHRRYSELPLSDVASVVVVQSLPRRMVGSGRLGLVIRSEGEVRLDRRRPQAGRPAAGDQPAAAPPARGPGRRGAGRASSGTPRRRARSRPVVSGRAATVPSEACTRQAGVGQASMSTAPGAA